MNSVPETPASPSPAGASSRRRRWLRHFLWTLAFLVTATALFYAIEDFRGWRAWRQEVARLKQNGEPLTWAEIVPPMPPEAENLAFAPPFKGLLDYRLPPLPSRFAPPAHAEGSWEEALKKAKVELAPPGYGKLPELVVWFRGQRVDLSAWARHFHQPKLPKQVKVRFPAAPKGAAPAEQVLAALQLYAPRMAAIRRACRRPCARFPVHYEENFTALLPHLEVLHDYGRLFTLHGVAELRRGNTAAALADLEVLFKLRTALHDEPLLISQLVRAALHQGLLQLVWEGMTEHRWSPRDLERIRAALASDNFLSDFVWGIRGERIGAVNTLEQMCEGRLSVAAFFSLTATTPESLYGFIPDGWIRQNMVRLSRFYRELGEVGDTNRFQVDWAALEAINQHAREGRITPYNFFAKLMAPALKTVFRRAVATQAGSHLALTARALEQRFQKTGAYPESLEALTSGDLPRWMHDPFDDHPLRYRRSAPDACLLYSVGSNLRDDDGTPRQARQPDTVGDLIWRLPASSSGSRPEAEQRLPHPRPRADRRSGSRRGARLTDGPGLGPTGD